MGIPAVCVLQDDVDIDLARHMCRYRCLSGGKSIKDVVLYTYRKRYEEPSRTEGFDQILKIPLSLNFNSLFEEESFYWHLPSL